MHAPTTLTHEDLRRWRDCPRRYWLHRHAHPSSTANLARPALEQDKVWPTQALRATFPAYVAIDQPATPAQWDAAVRRTQDLLQEGYLASPFHEGRAILGACLRSNDGALVRMDVLTAGMHGLRLFKVRQATVGDEDDLDAVAMWAHVSARCGLRLQSAGLMLIDPDFIYPGHDCYAGLFREADLTPVLGSRTIPNWLLAMQACEKAPEPATTDDATCQEGGACEFAPHCGVPPPANKPSSRAHLDVVGKELAATLRAEGHVDLHSVPEERMPDGRRLRALRAVQNDMPVLDARVSNLVRALPYPRHTIRFDTIGFATPIWAGTRPYQVLPFQWTCDTDTAAGQLIRQSFLAKGDTDPRRAFATSLLQALGTRGAIVAYNAGFERNRIRDLAMCFEDLATDLECLLPRIVDLFQLARAHYYHPAMCGSWSFKSLCRATAPQMHADRFEWHGITAAQDAFAASITKRGLHEDDLARLRHALIEHGRRQTAALRSLLALFERAGQRR